MLVAPGPLVPIATHEFQETLVYHSAANAHACSCFTETSVVSGLRKIESSRCVIIHPERLNMVVEDCSFRKEIM